MSEEAPSSVRPGQRIGRYEIVRHLGAGGMGGVYEARHVDLDKRVAVKVLDRKLAKNKVYLERFLREGRLAAKLNHPNVVDVSDVGTHQGVPYLVMELLVGSDLDAHLDEVGRLEVSEAIDILLPILAALVQAHAAGLVHRDLKPANIFLARSSDGGFHPKLLDFGIAKPNAEDGSDLTSTSDVFGTPQFMAPEQIRKSRDATARADQYSMGAVLYRCVTGADAVPLGESSVFELLERVVAGAVVPPSVVLPELALTLEPALVRAMARHPEDRYRNIKAFGAALLPYASPAAKRRWEATFAEPDALENTLIPEALSSPATARSARDTTPEKGTTSLVGSSRDLSARLAVPRRRPWGLFGAGACALALVSWFALRSDPAQATKVASPATMERGEAGAEEPPTVAPIGTPQPTSTASTTTTPTAPALVELATASGAAIPTAAAPAQRTTARPTANATTSPTPPPTAVVTATARATANPSYRID